MNLNIPVIHMIAMRVIRGNGVVAGSTFLKCVLQTSAAKVLNHYCGIASSKVLIKQGNNPCEY